MEKAYPNEFVRCTQDDWAAPNCTTWTSRLEAFLSDYKLEETVLIGHSVGCATIVQWHTLYQKQVKGALLVAPSDVDKPDYPSYITGFSPMPLAELPFPTIVVASSNDHVVSPERAKYFADCWGSQFELIENAGHIEDKTGYGEWQQGLDWLKSI
ncbi:MAG: alpha/beta hydrolase [Bacteroidota bacterium]